MTLLYTALSPDKSWMEAPRSWMRTSRWKSSNCPLQEAPAPPSGTAFENTTKPGVPAPIPPTVIRVFCALDGFTGPKAAGRLFPPASLLRRARPADVRNHSSSFLTPCREDPCHIIVRRHDFSAPAASLRSALRTRGLCGEPFFPARAPANATALFALERPWTRRARNGSE